MEIPFFKNCRNAREVELVTEVIERGMYWANGPEIAAFEQALADFSGCRHALAFNTGTAALHAVLEAIGVRDREVIVPSYTFIATANAVLMAGGKPVFADIERDTFGLDPHDVAAKITPRTKALVPVHYGGCACRINTLCEIAEAHDLILIEDAAESLGARYQGEMVGTFGTAAMFSFTPTKVISTGEGGALVTDSRELYEKLKLFRSHGRAESEDYFSSTVHMDYVTMGYNYRMPTICAALGLAQLEKLDRITEARRRIAARYNERLGALEDLRIPVVPSECHHIYQMYALLVKGGRQVRDGLQEFLKSKGITAKVYFEPVHHTEFYREKLGYRDCLPVTEAMAERTLSLPVFPDLGEAEQGYIIEQILDFIRNRGGK